MALAVRPLDLDDPVACAAADGYVDRHRDGTLFHLSAWARAVRMGMGHPVVTFAAWRGSELVGLLPLAQVSSRLFGRALISHAFAVYGGPIADDDAVHAALDAAAWAHAEAQRIPVLEYRSEAASRTGWAVKDQTYATFRRPLAAGEDEQLKAIPRKQRAEVRKSLEKGLEVRIDRDVARHYAVYAESVRNLGTPVFPRAWFEALLACFGDAADILTVCHDGMPAASVLSFYYKGDVLPYYGGGTLAARELRANDHMYFRLMGHAVARGCSRFDFGRSKLGTGAFAFKKNWGFEPTPLQYQYRLAPGREMPDLNPKNPRYELMVSLWQKLPLPIANTLGPLLARNLA